MDSNNKPQPAPPKPLPKHEQDALAFRQSVKRLRESKGWTQNHLAERLREAGLEEFHQITVARLETGRRAVRLGEAGVIASVLDSTVQTMLIPSTDISKEIMRISEIVHQMKSIVHDSFPFIFRYELNRESIVHSLEEIDRLINSGEKIGSLEKSILSDQISELSCLSGENTSKFMPTDGIMASSQEILTRGINVQLRAETLSGGLMAISGEEDTPEILFNSLSERAEKILHRLGLWIPAYYETLPEKREQELADLEEGEN